MTLRSRRTAQKGSLRQQGEEGEQIGASEAPAACLVEVFVLEKMGNCQHFGRENGRGQNLCAEGAQRPLIEHLRLSPTPTTTTL
jgi:hypothetical protein